MEFRGWPVEALEFFEGLEAENSKSYWQRNKSVYETAVRAPMEALIEELGKKWGDGRVMRPYRDIRFSPDKSPYKTYIAATVGPGYIHLSSESLGVGSGMWEMAPDQLERYRQAVVDDRSGKKLARVVTEARSAGLDATGHEVLKSAPRGFPKDHARIDLLRYKGLIAWQEWPTGAWLGTRRTKDRIDKFLELAKPMNAWLREHVGSSGG